MRVALLSTNDIAGGAAIVTLRLTHALRRAGVEATMVAARRSGDDPAVVPAGSGVRFGVASYAERLKIFMANGRDRASLFLTDIAERGMPLHRHPAVRRADVVVVAWVNQGLLSLDELHRIASEKPVVVVMHDMWWLTGICHHAGDCRRFTDGCGMCPQLNGKGHQADLSERTWRRKMQVYSNPGIHFVAVSSWLRQKCIESPLMQGKEVEVIPNPFPVEDFIRGPFLSLEELGVPPLSDPHGMMVAMGAARLDDPIKCFPLAIEALNDLHGSRPEMEVHAVFFGALRDPSALDTLKVPYTWLGPVADARTIRSIYRHATAVLSSSSYETLPTTLVEGQAAGCFPVSFDRGGQADIITHGSTGYLAPFHDTHALALGLASGSSIRYTDSGLAARLRASAARFDAPAVAARYIDLFGRLIGAR